MKLLFVGDIMPGGVLPYQNKYIDNEIFDYLKKFDFRIGTLESAIGTNIPFDYEKMNRTKGVIYSREKDMYRLSEMGINIVSLANNHLGDLGEEGILNTINQCDELDILHTGAGRNIDEAKKPVVISFNNEQIAILGCMVDCDSPVIFHKASKTNSGIYQVPIYELLKEIRALKAKYDKLILMPHWGEEHKCLPPAFYKIYAKQLLEAGADCIIGSHPHIINPVVEFCGKPVYFSLGNFLFPDKCMYPPRPVYYPDSVDEYRKLKRVWTYPSSISQPVVAVWKPRNRIGMMVEMNVGKTIITSYKLTCLTSDNILHHYNSLLIRIRMYFWALLVKMPHYGIIRRLYNYRYNLVRRTIDKLPAFNIPVKL